MSHRLDAGFLSVITGSSSTLSLPTPRLRRTGAGERILWTEVEGYFRARSGIYFDSTTVRSVGPALHPPAPPTGGFGGQAQYDEIS